jgi:hypothetical protein
MNICDLYQLNGVVVKLLLFNFKINKCIYVQFKGILLKFKDKEINKKNGPY